MTSAFHEEKNRGLFLGNNELLLSALLFYPYALTVFNTILRHFIADTYKIDTLLIYEMLLILLISTLNGVLKEIGLFQLVSVILIAFAFSIAYLIAADRGITLEVAQRAFLLCIPLFLVASTVSDFARLRKYITLCAHLVPLLLALALYTQGTGQLERTYSQSMGYSLLLPTTVLLSHLFYHFNWKTLFCFCLSSFLMLSFGARGPLVTVALFFMLKAMLKFSSAKGARKWAILLCALTVLSAVFLNFDALLLWLMNIIKRLGYSTRVFDRLMGGTLFEDIGREVSFRYSLELIVQHPILGVGLLNDRMAIAIMTNMFSPAIGWYPHNLILEIILQFGIPIGTILLISLTWLIFRCINGAKAGPQREVLLISIANGLIPLIFSGSYTESADFYILIGLCVASLRLEKNTPLLLRPGREENSEKTL